LAQVTTCRQPADALVSVSVVTGLRWPPPHLDPNAAWAYLSSSDEHMAEAFPISSERELAMYFTREVVARIRTNIYPYLAPQQAW
jgi:hypothetical protein